MKPYLMILLVLISLLGNKENHAGEQLEINNIYGTKNIGSLTFYTKIEPSGCSTKIMMNSKRQTIDLTYGGMCNASFDELESVMAISTSFVSIINYFSLENEIKLKRVLSINVIWKVSHWPLILDINFDSTWPKNISKLLLGKYPNRTERFEVYKKLLRKQLLKNSVYLPFTKSLENLGCNLMLKEQFSDPIFFDDKNIKKNELEKLKVFEGNNTKKDVYPLFKGPVEFNMKCSKRAVG